MTAGLGYHEIQAHYDKVREKENLIRKSEQWLYYQKLDGKEPTGMPENLWIMDSNCGNDLQLNWVQCICGEKFDLTSLVANQFRIDYPTVRKHISQSDYHFIVERGYECYDSKVQVHEEFSRKDTERRGRR